MRVLVTGSAGFVGRHMVAELRVRGWDVIEWDIVHGRDALEYFRTADEKLDLVVHCAASEPHRAAIDGDQMNMVRNLHLDSAMFNWAVRTGTRVLYLSSSAVYPVGWQRGHMPVELSEETADILSNRIAGSLLDLVDGRMSEFLPDAAYGLTKWMGEKMAAAAAEHIPVHVVRPFSGYGEDQDERFPFGAFVARARRREDPFVIWGDGTQTRDWIHITDVVRGALAVVERDVRYPVNLCTGIGTSMLDLVKMMCERVGYEPDIKLLTDKPTGVAYRVGDPTRFHRIYQPRTTIQDGVRRALT